MIYTAGHPILIVCDSKRDSTVNDTEIEQALETTKDYLLQFIRDNTKFNPFNVEVMYTNINSRLRGDQCMISLKISYITDMLDSKSKFEYITELDAKHFLYELKKFKHAYGILDNLLDLSTLVLHTGEYKDLEFCLGCGEEPNY